MVSTPRLVGPSTSERLVVRVWVQPYSVISSDCAYQALIRRGTRQFSVTDQLVRTTRRKNAIPNSAVLRGCVSSDTSSALGRQRVLRRLSFQATYNTDAIAKDMFVYAAVRRPTKTLW